MACSRGVSSTGWLEKGGRGKHWMACPCHRMVCTGVKGFAMDGVHLMVRD